MTMKKLSLILLFILMFFVLGSCSSIENNHTISNNTTEINSISTIGNETIITFDIETSKNSRTQTMPSTETKSLIPQTRSNRLAELIDDSYKDFTAVLKEEYENYFNSLNEMSLPVVFTYLNKEEYEKIGGRIVYGVFDGYIVYYAEPVVFDTHLDNVAGYWFIVSGDGVIAYKNEQIYTLFNAYELGLLTFSDVAKIYEIHRQYCIDFEFGEKYDEYVEEFIKYGNQ